MGADVCVSVAEGLSEVEEGVSVEGDGATVTKMSFCAPGVKPIFVL